MSIRFLHDIQLFKLEEYQSDMSDTSSLLLALK
jgi:hypothetical protein